MIEVINGSRVRARWLRMIGDSNLPGGQLKGSGGFMDVTGVVMSVDKETGTCIIKPDGEEPITIRMNWVRQVVLDKTAAFAQFLANFKGGSYLIEQELEAAFKEGWDAALDEAIRTSRTISALGGLRPAAEEVIESMRK